MLVGPHGGGVDTHDGPVDGADGIRVLLDVGQEPVPGAVGRPAAETFVDRLPRPVPLGQVPPCRTRGQLPQNPVDHLTAVPHRPAHPRRSQQRLDHRPRLIGQLMTTHHEQTNDADTLRTRPRGFRSPAPPQGLRDASGEGRAGFGARYGLRAGRDRGR
ncbi:hypothetical protein SGPA1_41052 [Streptomyces misionensis JCM 4497]